MARFKAGDMIISKTDEGYSVLMVNGVIEGEMYSVDDGNGFIDARDTVANVDRDYEFCGEIPEEVD